MCENIQARLDMGDANFVVAIHTNGDSVFNGGLGTIQPMGHLDFYPNGGIVQKGCETLLTGMAKKVLSFDCKLKLIVCFLCSSVILFNFFSYAFKSRSWM